MPGFWFGVGKAGKGGSLGPSTGSRLVCRWVHCLYNGFDFLAQRHRAGGLRRYNSAVDPSVCFFLHYLPRRFVICALCFVGPLLTTNLILESFTSRSYTTHPQTVFKRVCLNFLHNHFFVVECR